MFVSELKTCFDLPRQCCAQNCLPTTLPRPLRQRGSLATLRNRRPSARCVTVARWGGLCVARCLAHIGRGICKFKAGPLCQLLVRHNKGSLWAEHVLCSNLCPLLSSPGRLYLATFANLVADRTAVCLTQVFALPQCACGNHSTSLPHPTTRPWNIVRHKKHSTQLCSIPPNTKYITLPLKCAAFNPSNNSGQGKGKFQVNRLIQYSNFDTGVSALSSLV